VKVITPLLIVSYIACITAIADENQWERSIAAGVNLTSGNSDTLAINGSIAAENEGDTHETRVGIEGDFGESEVDSVDETTAQNGKLYAIYKYKFKAGYLYTDNSLFHDDMADIEYRLVLGGGAGYHVLKTEDIKLGLEMGTALIREELTDDTREDDISLRFAARHDQDLGEHSKFWLAMEYLPNVDDTKDYLLNGEAGLEAAVNSSLSLRAVVQDRYDNVVPEGREENDLAVISSLVYKL